MPKADYLHYIEKICVFFVGIVLFLGIRIVITPPTVSIPKDKGITSNSIIARY